MRRPLTTLTVALGALTAVAIGASYAAASSPDLFGLGARGQAMAGAVASTASGFESTFHNPAGLAFDRRPTFALGYQLATFDLESNGAAVATRSAPVLSIGFGVPLPFGGALEDRVALGLGFNIPQRSILIADIARPGEPTFVLVGNRAQTVSVLGSLAVRIADELAVGLGALALARLVGDIQVEPSIEGTLGTRVRDELLADYAFIGGLTARPTGWLSIALTYRQASRADFDLPISADLGSRFDIPLPVLDVRGTAQFDPASVALEVSAHPTPWLLLALGATWRQWSAFPLPIVTTAAPEGTPPQPPPDFSDTWVVRFGAEADLALDGPDLRLQPRLGFAWEPSPVPEQRGFHNHLDSDRAIFGLGVGLRIDRLRVDLAAQLHHMAPRAHTKDPALADPETNPGFPGLEHRGLVVMGALELGLTL